eukprot:GEMP01096471.1.p2 GENE.GEMP01096471.1~~GEMP01096471.1.p2  ORF type:complete len:120 (+),score=13.37 GEMP01096471.1:161-520(+)
MRWMSRDVRIPPMAINCFGCTENVALATSSITIDSSAVPTESDELPAKVRKIPQEIRIIRNEEIPGIPFKEQFRSLRREEEVIFDGVDRGPTDFLKNPSRRNFFKNDFLNGLMRKNSDK